VNESAQSPILFPCGKTGFRKKKPLETGIFVRYDEYNENRNICSFGEEQG
jgi:hypothetical protein